MNYKKIFLVAFLFIVIFGFAKASFINEAIASPSPYIKVISPNGGEVVSFDKPFSIAWSSAGTQLAYIYLLSPDGGTCRIDGVNASLGKYSKVIKQGEKCLNTSKTIQPGQYKILIYGDTQGAEDTSDGFFDLTGGVYTTIPPVITTTTIASPSPYIKVISPNGGEVVSFDKPFSIAWSSAGTQLAYIYLLSPDGGTCRIDGVNASLGKYSKVIKQGEKCLNTSKTIQPGQYKILIYGDTQGAEDTSDGFFDLTGGVVTTTVQPDIATLSENDGISFIQVRIIEFKSIINNLIRQLNFSVVSRPTIPVATTTTISSPATTTTKPITTTTIMPLIENDISFMQARMIEFKSMINNLMQQLGALQW